MLAFEIIVLVLVFLTTVGLGMRISLTDLFRAFRDWDALILVVAGQYLLMPALTWLAIQALGPDMRGGTAIAVVLLGPGSEAAAVGVFLARANLPLAVISVVVTNVLSPLIAPTLIDLLAHPDPEKAAAMLPLLSDIMAIMFLALIVPLALGMTLRQLSVRMREDMDRPFRILMWSMFALNVVYAAFSQTYTPVSIAVPQTVPLLAIVMVATFAALILVYSIGRLAGIRPENAVTASFIVSLQPVAIGVYIATNLKFDWPELTTLSISYAMVLPLAIALWILVVGRRLHFARRPR